MPEKIRDFFEPDPLGEEMVRFVLASFVDLPSTATEEELCIALAEKLNMGGLYRVRRNLRLVAGNIAGKPFSESLTIEMKYVLSLAGKADSRNPSKFVEYTMMMMEEVQKKHETKLRDKKDTPDVQ